MAVAVDALPHRVGLGWRKPLAPGILTHLDRVDVVEVMAEDLFDAPRAELSAMKTLSRQLPVVVHGLSLGLASGARTDPKRLSKLAKVVEQLAPDFWSEHLAFVRSDGLEIGHLAAPPRCAETLDGLFRNVNTAARVSGARPLLENIATLITPAGSTLDEAEFVSSALEAADADMLLDLHNLYANSQNFGFDPYAFLERMAPERIRAVHLAGGRWIRGSAGQRRLLDDHLHPVPDELYRMLSWVAERATRPLTVIIERDGRYPAFQELLLEVERAREALRVTPLVRAPGKSAPRAAARNAASAQLEAYLARLYVDSALRQRFIADREALLAAAQLDFGTRAALQNVDVSELELAAHSYEHKRSQRR
ncbi:MAG: DUF692 domain-containing protein [Polyangiaceae bacterium]